MTCKRILILCLLLCTCVWCGAQEKIDLYGVVEQKALISLPITTNITDNEVQVTIGTKSIELRDMNTEKVSLWIFYEDVSLAEFETMNIDADIDGKSALKKEVLGREGFIGVHAPGLVLQGRGGIKYEKITRNLELKFKAESDSVVKSSVSLYLYAGKISPDSGKRGKKSTRIFAALRPYIIEVEFPSRVDLAENGNNENAPQRMQLTAGAYTNSEKGDSAMFEGFKKNMTLYVERANNILEKANLARGSAETVTAFRKDLDALKIDMDMEMRFVQSSSYASKMAMDAELMDNVKQFEKIYKEVYDVEQEVKETAAVAATNNGAAAAEEEKKTNPLSYFVLGGIGLTIVMALFLFALTKVMNMLQKKRDAVMQKQLKKQQKKAKAEQERMKLEQSGTPRKRIKV